MQRLVCMQPDGLQMRAALVEYVSQMEHRVLATAECFNPMMDDQGIIDQRLWHETLDYVYDSLGRSASSVALMPFRSIKEGRLVERHLLRNTSHLNLPTLMPEKHSLPLGLFTLDKEARAQDQLVIAFCHNRIELEHWQDGRCQKRQGIPIGLRLVQRDIEKVVGVSDVEAYCLMKKVDMFQGQDLSARVIRARIHEILEFIEDSLETPFSDFNQVSLVGEGLILQGLPAFFSQALSREIKVLRLSLKGEWRRKQADWVELGCFIRQTIAQTTAQRPREASRLQQEGPIQKLRNLFAHYF